MTNTSIRGSGDQRISIIRWALPLLVFAKASALAPPESSTSVRVNVNVPSLVELVKTREARSSTLEKAMFLGQSAKYLLGPDAVSLEPPSDMKGFVSQALRGQASVTVDTALGEPQHVDVQVLASDWGALTVQIRNPLLPKLPFAGLPGTPAVVSKVLAPAMAEAAPSALELAQAVAEKIQEPPPPPFWQTPIEDFAIDLPNGYHRDITPLDVLGTSSLALGAAYAGSYAWYVAEQEREAKEAADRKKAMAAKRAAANNPKPKDEKSTSKNEKASKKTKTDTNKRKESTAKTPKETNKKTDPQVKQVEQNAETTNPGKDIGEAKQSEKIEAATVPKSTVPVSTPPPKSVSSTLAPEATKPLPSANTITEEKVKAPAVAVASPPVTETVVLKSTPEPKLQRTATARDTSIAIAKDEVTVDDDDEYEKERQPTRKRDEIFRILKRLFGRPKDA